MKRILALLTFVAFTCSICTAQFPGFRFQKNEEKRYTLNVGQVTMAIDANNGARIISLKHDTTEILSQINFPNQYGSTFWTSPQKEWNWPPVKEHDMAPYQVEEKDGAIIMTSPLSEKIPLRIIKKFEVDQKDQCFVVTYTIVNESDAERKVAPWEITRVLAHGSVYFDADVDAITPAGLMNFVKKDNYAWYDIDYVQGQNRKINADGKGWLSFTNGDLILTKKFQDLDATQPAPDEAEIQVYVNQGDTYVELESQGAYTNLKPKEALNWAVRWYLTKADKK
ncbi:MAG: hypothetical protein MJ211_00450 [Bacteroidales bacterium]|nr:hypothetical protein [Bacteroidales bacterium]